MNMRDFTLTWKTAEGRQRRGGWREERETEERREERKEGVGMLVWFRQHKPRHIWEDRICAKELSPSDCLQASLWWPFLQD